MVCLRLMTCCWLLNHKTARLSDKIPNSLGLVFRFFTLRILWVLWGLVAEWVRGLSETLAETSALRLHYWLMAEPPHWVGRWRLLGYVQSP